MFAFRGDRTYIHATTLFDHIINSVINNNYDPYDIDFSLNRMTDKQCLIIPCNESGRLNAFAGQYRDNQSCFVITETSTPITERIPYNESEIASACSIRDKMIIVPGSVTRFSFIEKVIAAYKHLLIDLFNTSYGRYMFARIQLSHIPSGGFSILHERIISDRYFQGAILTKDTRAGTIHFGIQRS